MKIKIDRYNQNSALSCERDSVKNIDYFWLKKEERIFIYSSSIYQL